MYTRPGKSICMYGRIGRRKNYGEIVKKKCTHTPHAYEYAAMNTRATSLHTYSLRERERGSSSNRFRMMPMNSEMNDCTLIFKYLLFMHVCIFPCLFFEYTVFKLVLIYSPMCSFMYLFACYSFICRFT